MSLMGWDQLNSRLWARWSSKSSTWRKGTSRQEGQETTLPLMVLLTRLLTYSSCRVLIRQEEAVTAWYHLLIMPLDKVHTQVTIIVASIRLKRRVRRWSKTVLLASNLVRQETLLTLTHWRFRMWEFIMKLQLALLVKKWAQRLPSMKQTSKDMPWEITSYHQRWQMLQEDRYSQLQTGRTRWQGTEVDQIWDISPTSRVRVWISSQSSLNTSPKNANWHWISGVQLQRLEVWTTLESWELLPQQACDPKVAL